MELGTCHVTDAILSTSSLILSHTYPTHVRKHWGNTTKKKTKKERTHNTKGKKAPLSCSLCRTSMVLVDRTAFALCRRFPSPTLFISLSFDFAGVAQLFSRSGTTKARRQGDESCCPKGMALPSLAALDETQNVEPRLLPGPLLIQQAAALIHSHPSRTAKLRRQGGRGRKE